MWSIFKKKGTSWITRGETRPTPWDLVVISYRTRPQIVINYKICLVALRMVAVVCEFKVMKLCLVCGPVMVQLRLGWLHSAHKGKNMWAILFINCTCFCLCKCQRVQNFVVIGFDYWEKRESNKDFS